MNEILVSMLFLYPGALVEVVQKEIFRYTYVEDKGSEVAHLARYFIYSVFVTLLSVFMYAFLREKEISTMSDIFLALNSPKEIFGYTVLSLIGTVIIACADEIFARLTIKVKNKFGKGSEDTSLIIAADAWHQIAYSQEETLKECRQYMIAKVYNGGQESAGFIKYLPGEFEQGLILVWQSEIQKQLEKEKNESEEKRLIGDPVLTYFDPKSSTLVELFDGRKFAEQELLS